MLSVILGWPDHYTTIMMGATVVTYTVLGGIKAVTWTRRAADGDHLPGPGDFAGDGDSAAAASVSFGDAVYLAGAAGRLNAVTTNFDWNDRFNIWSGLIGGTFLFALLFRLRPIAGAALPHREIDRAEPLSLLFNAVAKVPMQFFILFVGAMVFVFYLFVQPPVLFQQVELKRIAKLSEYQPMSDQYQRAFEHRKQAALALVEAHRAGNAPGENREKAEYRSAQKELDAVRTSAAKLVESTGGEKGFNDTNYIFLSFVTKYLPSGIVGLVIAVIFAATMSASSGEINSLATVTVIDLYQRHFKRSASDVHYLWASRWFTLFWGVYAVVFARVGEAARFADCGGQ